MAEELTTFKGEFTTQCKLIKAVWVPGQLTLEFKPLDVLIWDRNIEIVRSEDEKKVKSDINDIEVGAKYLVFGPLEFYNSNTFGIGGPLEYKKLSDNDKKDDNSSSKEK